MRREMRAIRGIQVRRGMRAMRRMRAIAVVLVIGVVGGIFLSVGYVNPYGGVCSLSELVLQLSGSRGNFSMGFSMPELLSLALRMIPDFLLEMYLGTRLYRHFCTACVYVFSRYPGRVSWYGREVAALGVQVALSQAVLLAAVLGVSALRNEILFDHGGMLLLAEHFVLKSLWILGMTLGVNLFSIGFGSNLAFLGIMGAQAACITLLGIAETVGRTVSKGVGVMMLNGNPMAYMVLGWQDGENAVLPELLESGTAGPVRFGAALRFGKKEALLLYLALCAGVILAGAFTVKRCDLLGSNTEEGEI